VVVSKLENISVCRTKVGSGHGHAVISSVESLVIELEELRVTVARVELSRRLYAIPAGVGAVSIVDVEVVVEARAPRIGTVGAEVVAQCPVLVYANVV